MSTEFSPGQEVFWLENGSKCHVIAVADNELWVRNVDGSKSVRFDNCFVATDPNAPKSQKVPNCPFCGSDSSLIGGCCRRAKCANIRCQFEGPCRESDEKAIEAWESIRIQGKYGTVKYNCGFEAIDDIHSLQEHCVKRGMPNDPIGGPGTPASMRNQIIRFIDKLVDIRDSHYEALRDRRV